MLSTAIFITVVAILINFDHKIPKVIFEGAMIPEGRGEQEEVFVGENCFRLASMGKRKRVTKRLRRRGIG
jgi:hypothetical protein